MALNYSISLLFIFSFLHVFSLDSLRAEKVDGKMVVIHQVEKGETLYSLSKRYGTEITEVVSFNGITDNTISLGQMLRIPFSDESNQTKTQSPLQNTSGYKVHEVKTGETLFSISQLYGLRVYQLKEMNNLNTNDISIGQKLFIKEIGSDEPDNQNISLTEQTGTDIVTTDIKTTTPDEVEALPYEDDADFIAYKVQSGDDLSTIAMRYGVRMDSLKYWNQLATDHIDIGQELRLKQKVDKVLAAPKIVKTPYGIKKRMMDQSGFVRIVEEGIALKIEDVIPTDKYLCLHRDQPVGSLVEVRNLMNNQKVFVKVVARLPDTGLNENVLIRLTPPAFKRLGIIDPRARVEISYYEE